MRPLMRHNPAFLAPEELDAGFIVRLSDLTTLVDIVRENTDRPSNQHVLVIAARGMGKTTLVLRTANAVRSDPELSARWYPIVWGEEAYSVGTAGEFWLETLLHLGDQTEDARWSGAHAELLDETDEQRLQERALARLMDFADEQGRRLLIVVENLQMILGEQMAHRDKGSGWVLRHTLQNEPRIMLLATSTMRFDQISRRSEALYDLFLEHRLDPLTRDECRTLWERVSGEPLSAGRARPIEILTGGNTRLLSILASFAAGRSFRELMTDLVQLVDEHTDYFKSNFEALSLSERRVFSALADLWQPSLAREVARQARVEVNEASRDLGRLEARGPITVVGEKGRAKLYQLTERLYNLYHLMRRRGSPAQRVRAAVEFIIHLYPEDDVKPVMTKIAGEALGLESCVRQDHVWAWTEVARRLTPELQREVVREAPGGFWDLPDLPKQAWELAAQDDDFLRERFPLVFAFKDRMNDPKAETWIRERRDALVQQIERLHDVLPNYLLGWLLSALIYTKLDDRSRTARSLRRTIAHSEASGPMWRWLAWALRSDPAAQEERNKALAQAALIAGDDVVELYQLGDLLADLGEWERAEQLARKCLALEPGNGGHLLLLGRALLQQRRTEEAIPTLEQALAALPTDAAAAKLLGEAHLKAGRLDHAEQSLRAALALDPTRPETHTELGWVLGQLERPDEAEAALRQAVALDDRHGMGWFGLAIHLLVLRDDVEGAQTAFKRAMATLTGPPALATTITILPPLLRRGAVSAALTFAQDLLQREGYMPETLYELAKAICTSTSDPEALTQALTWAQQATTLAPASLHIRHTYATLLGKLDRWTESLTEARLLLADADWCRSHLDDLIHYVVEAAAAGQARPTLAALKPSPAAAVAEPLVVALELELGENPRAPQEIAEVARDVVERIQARRANPSTP